MYIINVHKYLINALKVSHVEKGMIASLKNEIKASLAVSTLEDVQPLRVDLYSANEYSCWRLRDRAFRKNLFTRGSLKAPNCGGDLQSYISYIISRKDKLAFLRSEVPEAELIHIFLKGLTPVFSPIQVHFAIPGTMPDTFDKVVAIVRKFSTNPLVADQIARAKPTANVFISNTSRYVSRETGRERVLCKLFTCSYGDKCRFSHGSSQKGSLNASMSE